MKQLGLALLMYAQDYDDKFCGTYQKAGQAADWPLIHWWDLIEPYLKNRQMLACPSYDSFIGYGANTYVMPDSRGNFNASMGDITHPAETILLTDAWNANSWCMRGNWIGPSCSATCFGARAAGIRNDGVNISRHNDGFNATLCDGHVKWFKGGQADWDYDHYWRKVR